jgi:hypothetical protein
MLRVYLRGRTLRCGALALTGRSITPQKVGPIRTPIMREEASLLGVSLTGRFCNSSMENNVEKVFKVTSAHVTGHPRQG